MNLSQVIRAYSFLGLLFFIFFLTGLHGLLQSFASPLSFETPLLLYKLLLFSLWPSAVNFFIAFSYFTDPELAVVAVRKCVKSGEIPLSSFLVFLPWFLEVWVFWGLKQVLRPEDVFNLCYTRPSGQKVYVSKFPLFWEHMPKGIKFLVDLTLEFPANRQELEAREIRYLCAPSLDVCMCSAESCIDIMRVLYGSKEGDLFVHCANGHGRSALIVAMLMILDFQGSSPSSSMSSPSPGGFGEGEGNHEGKGGGEARRAEGAPSIMECRARMRLHRKVNWQPHQQKSVEIALEKWDRVAGDLEMELRHTKEQKDKEM